MLTIGLVVKNKSPIARQTLQQLLALMPNQRFLVEEAGPYALIEPPAGVAPASTQQMEQQSQLLMVLGGDGTLIHAASLLQERIVPILGINLGHVGFLTEMPAQTLQEVLQAAIANQLPFSDRMRFNVQVVRQGEVQLQRQVLNDAVLAMRSLARIATYHATYNGQSITSIRGDGVIVATPTGSTAYSLASGGPIVVPEMQAMVLTPICPHQLTQRPIILPATGHITISLVSDSDAFVSLDGHAGCPLMQEDMVSIQASSVPTRLLSLPERSFFDTLREKLRWGIN